MNLGFNMFFTIVTVQISIIFVMKAAGQSTTEACNSCCTSGIPGIPGQHGNPGVSGPQGMNGVKGEQGMNGVKGDQGFNGVKGDQGMKGEQGFIGEHGLKGEQGPQGLIGLPGANGVKGEKGEQASQQKSAFAVVFSSNPGRHAVSPMKYDTIITNVGNDYNLDTGKFVCAIPGVYVFQVTSLKSSGSSVLTHIMKNGNFQVSAYTAGTGDISASAMVILDLVSGDQVWTQPLSTSYNYYYDNINRYCSFSGFLLYAA